ncbi:hypothetical protein WJX72_002751 [[Myrmecia] bisecta]|uniref:Transcription factor IIIC subunit 5 HTH domain-containing protein n=1 Tax=[Myrmecia] bisecta TaxID=41462 RepID=A0AAW1QEH4_9CHLO
MVSVTQPVPSQQVLLVEYPGYVQNVDAALDTLGGTQAIAAQHNGTSNFLALRFRPGDPLTHPVFTGLADYQYVGQDSRPAEARMPQGSSPFGVSEEALLCAPPLFTKMDIPLDYAFRSFYSDDPASFKAGLGGAKKGKLAAHVINFFSVIVPQPPSTEPAAGGALDPGVQSVLALLGPLLRGRAIWSLALLAEQLPDVSRPELEAALPKACYVFRNGPWRGLWIRRGYNPRDDSGSRAYQALEYHLPAEWYAAIAAQKRLDGQNGAAAASTSGPGAAVPPTASNMTDLHRFVAVPSTQETVLQLHDLQDDRLQALLKDAPRLQACDAKTGWFSGEVWVQIQGLVKARFQQLLDRAFPGGGQPQHIADGAEAMEVDAAEQPSTTADETADNADGGGNDILPATYLRSLLAQMPPDTAHQGPPDASGAAYGQMALDDEYEIFEDDDEEDDNDDEGGESDQ